MLQLLDKAAVTLGSLRKIERARAGFVNTRSKKMCKTEEKPGVRPQQGHCRTRCPDGWHGDLGQLSRSRRLTKDAKGGGKHKRRSTVQKGKRRHPARADDQAEEPLDYYKENLQESFNQNRRGALSRKAKGGNKAPSKLHATRSSVEELCHWGVELISLAEPWTRKKARGYAQVAENTKEKEKSCRAASRRPGDS